ncbi:single-stranded DNA-binding protein [Leifsonia sp. YIM 134122]|uniref:Single-stranded DNA-binding protein n=1 Tax=Leifsonia stereocauli TaxID=3134136 RepID=A0ABU9W3D8_9MICO
MSNPITIVGNVGTDPTAAILPGGARKVTFRIAVSERYYDRKKNEWVDADPSWFTVEAFRTLGEHVEQSVHRGDNVIVSGRLRVRTWENDKGRGTAVDLEADAVGHNLAWGTSTYSKTHRTESASQDTTDLQAQQSEHRQPGTGGGGGEEAAQRSGWTVPLSEPSEAPALVGAGDTPF